MKSNILATLVAFAILAGSQLRADNMASIAITPATGVVTLTPRWAIGGNLAAFHEMAQDLGLGGGANQFYSIKSTAIPAGGDVSAFTLYIAGSGAATPHADIGSKLTPNSYSALTSADPDLGYGAVNFYLIHHKGTTDYFTTIVPGSGTSSAVTDLKPMSGPGGPATVTGVGGYFGLTFAAANLGYGLNLLYYFRADPVTGFTKFGTLDPALLGTSADKFDLGISGHKALVFTGTDVGYGTNKMYYNRLDPVTGFTIMGTLDPLTGKAADIANLGSVYTTLDYVPGDVGFGSGNFYTTGAVNTTWQSVSFAAIADRAISAGSFTVHPTASSTLPIVLTVVAGSVGSATISAPVAGVFTVTPTAPGLITLQATQAGSVAPAFEFNMLRQSFTATGTALPIITNNPLTAAGTVNTPFSFTITATGPATSYSAAPLPAGLSINTATGAITGTPSAVGITAVLLGATNVNGTGNATLTITVAAAATAPAITNNPLTAGGTVGAGFSFTITATGSPTSYSAAPLPAGLSIALATGVITGSPSTPGITTVLLGATNGTGTGNATLTITIVSAVVPAIPTTAPVITNTVLTAAVTAGAPFSYTITAAGSPTIYSTTALPPGLTLNSLTGVITGIPTTPGLTTVTLGATNALGTGNATLVILIGGTNTPPVFTNPISTTGTVGTPIVTFPITATGLPTSYSATGLPAGLSINPLTGAINGTPTVSGTFVVTITATNASGSSTTTLTIVIAADPSATSRIMNFSARAFSGPGDATLIMGFVVAGSGNGKNLLVRGIGPTLVSLGVVNFLADPMLTVYNGIGGTLAVNDDWGTTIPGQPDGSLIAPTAARVGAFALPVGSKDSALLMMVGNGAHTTGLVRPNSTSGVALVEIYDTDSTAGSRLVNVSARMNVGTGESTLIAGLVIGGNAPKTVLIRGVGPTLATLGVSGTLADPQLSLYSGSAVIASDDNWETGASTAAQIISASAQVGAFPLPTGSKDAALLITLQPGAYTVQLTGVGNTTGVALVEIYDTQ